MKAKLIWDEAKRKENLVKHGLDFANAGDVLASTYRLDVAVVRNGERRTQSFSYVFDRLCVLTVVHTDRDSMIRVISYRAASEKETESYYEWIASEQHDA